MTYHADTKIVNYRCNDGKYTRLPDGISDADSESFAGLLDDLECTTKQDKKKADPSIDTLQSQQYYINVKGLEQSSSSFGCPELGGMRMNAISSIVGYDELPAEEDAQAIALPQILLQIPHPLIDTISFNFPLKIELLSGAPSAAVGQAVTDAIQHAYRNKIHKVSVAINPPQFGHLDIELIFAGTQVKRVNIITTTEEALRVLTSSISIPALSNTLAENFAIQENAIELHLSLQHNNSGAYHGDQQLSHNEPEIAVNTAGCDTLPVLLPATSGVDIIV